MPKQGQFACNVRAKVKTQLLRAAQNETLRKPGVKTPVLYHFITVGKNHTNPVILL